MPCSSALQQRAGVIEFHSLAGYWKRWNLASQHFGEEVAVAARRLQEAGIDALGLLSDRVEHGVHLTLVGEHLSMFLNVRSRLVTCVDILSHPGELVDEAVADKFEVLKDAAI